MSSSEQETLGGGHGVSPVRIGAGLSGHLNPLRAGEQAAEQCRERLGLEDGDAPDLVMLFVRRAQHLEPARNIAVAVRRALRPRVLVGVSGEAVIGGETELEGSPGVAILAASLPGVSVKAFRTDDLPTVGNGSAADIEELAAKIGFGPEHRGTFLFADPFSVPINSLLPAMVRAREAAGAGGGDGRVLGPVLGGMASASGKPGGNAIILDDTMTRSGGVGVSLSGPVRVDSLVSQGCKPIGPALVVTGGKGQMITSLGGKSAAPVLAEIIESLDDTTRDQIRRGLFLGRAISEYKRRFGRDDFLIRNVIGIDPKSGAIAVADLIRIGQTVQFHVRDQATAAEDLSLLLDAQALHEPPAGGLLFTCTGRGRRLFDEPSHDAGAIARAFGIAGSEGGGGEILSKAGAAAPGPRATMPLAGFFAAGEIGPVGGSEGVFVHGQTACLALIRGGAGGTGSV